MYKYIQMWTPALPNSNFNTGKDNKVIQIHYYRIIQKKTTTEATAIVVPK